MKEKQEKNLEFQITQYLDGLLNEDESAQLEAQLETDPALREIFDKYQALQSKLESLGEDLPEIDFDLQRQQIMGQIDSRNSARSVKLTRRIFRPVFALTAVAAIVLISFGVLMIAKINLPTAEPKSVESIVLRPSPVHFGKVVATVSPASPEITTKRMVQILARRMDIKPVKRIEKSTPGTVVVSIGSQDFTSEDDAADSEMEVSEEYWF